MLFDEARPADYWWVLLDGDIDLVRRVGHEDTVLATMQVTRPVGGRLPGLGRARRLHGHRSRRVGRPGPPGAGGALSARARTAWFPFGVHLIKGLIATVRNIESNAASARRWSRSARSRPGSRTRSTTRRPRPPGPSTRCEECSDDAARRRSAGSPTESITAEQFVALDALRRGVDDEPARRPALALADREEALSDWLDDHGSTGLADRPALAAAGLDVEWCERAATCSTAEALQAGLEWVASALTTTTLIAEVKDSTRRISDLVAAVRSYSQLDRASCSAST